MRLQGDPDMIGGFIRSLMLAALLTLVVIESQAFGEEPIATLRKFDLAGQPDAPAIPKISNKDIKRTRNYPEQPPIIPHKIRGYQIDLNGNKCLTCHSRKSAAEAQAPMVSITHYMDRAGQVRAFVTARRYFCNQCHVPQYEVKILIENDFEDADTIVENLLKQEN